MRKYILAAALVLLTTVKLLAYPQLSDSASVSLLTCTPGTETYSKYGHSAIRIVDKANRIDWTFNYGLFSFNTDNFYLRFIQGQTYYQLGIEYTFDFIISSGCIGRTTYDQHLNLNQKEKQDLFDALMLNYEPQNRKYLYNFVFDNCATRPYHLLYRVITQNGDTLKTTEFDKRQNTYREKISYYSEKNSWAGFGINALFGKDADKEMSMQERLFLPEELMNFVSEATLSDGRMLCDEDNTKSFSVKQHSFWLSPYFAVFALCCLLIGLTLFDLKRGRQSWWADCTIFFVGGLLGIVLTYLSYFSIHPLVQHNYNLLLINPLLLVLFFLPLPSKTRSWLSEKEHYLGWLMIGLLLWRLLSGQAWHSIMYIPFTHAVRMILLSSSEINIKNILHKPCCKILVFISFLFSPIFSIASPRLTVVINIDGFSQSSMNMLRPYWQAGGLRTLDEEAHKSQMHFNHLVQGGNETLATIVCGCNPSTHGVSSNSVYVRADRKCRNPFIDEQEVCIGCNMHLSPRTILAPTVADVFRQQTTNRSRIFAIGQRAESTLLLAGHAANGCAWLEKDSLQWVTTGYYSAGLPAAADKMNVSGRLEQLAQRQWQPRMDINAYMMPTEEEKKHPFNYNQQQVLLNSPVANTMVIELALALQKEQNLGKHQTPDMLLMQLNTLTPAAKSDMLLTAEQEDMYLCLNQDLGYFFEQLDKQVGKDNYRVILFGTPHYGMGKEKAERSNMQVQEFNTDRAAALINTYLMAIYGHERWIDGGYEHSIYLNRILIEQKKMSIQTLQQQVSDFLLEFSGVQNAFPSSKLLFLQSPDCKNLQNSYNKQQFGDILFTLQPMWVTAQDRVIEDNPTAPIYVWTQERIGFPAEDIDATQAKNIILK